DKRLDKRRFDMGFGPTASGLATVDSVIFQAKMVLNCKAPETIKDVQNDARRLLDAGIRHGYLLVFWVVHPTTNALSPRDGQMHDLWRDEAHMRQEAGEICAGLRSGSATLLPIGEGALYPCVDWGPGLMDRWPALFKGDYAVFAQVFRVDTTAAKSQTDPPTEGV